MLPELPPSALLHTKEPADQMLALTGGQLPPVLIMLVGAATSPPLASETMTRVLWAIAILCAASYVLWSLWLFRNTLRVARVGLPPTRRGLRVLTGLTLAYGLVWSTMALLVFRYASGANLEALSWTLLAAMMLSTHYHAHGSLKRAAWLLLAMQCLTLVGAWVALGASSMAQFEASALVTVLLLSYAIAAMRECEYVEVRRRTGERLEEKSCLVQQIAHLQEAHSAKARLLAMVSHDLRQPVHALGLMLGRFRQDTSSSMRIEIEAVNDVVNSLSKSLTMLMAVTRLNSGQVIALPEPVSLERLFRSLANEFEATATAGHLHLRFESRDLTVTTDPNHLRTILANLISNAIKYTPHGGVEVLASVVQPDTVSIQVRDSGIGIPANELSRIFDPFVRLHFRKTSADGIGLGLAIVKQTADLIKAPLKVVSVVGKGTEFSMELPLSRVAQACGDPMPDTYLRGLRVVVVDNDETVLESMARTLEEWGCRVIASNDWEQLEVKLTMTVSPVDLVLTDFHLDGGFSGYELITRLRKMYGTQIPAILLTGDVEIRHGPDSTATSVVIAYKPLSRDKLARLIYDTISSQTSGA
jgi:signal transduction histidine kinase